MNKKLAFLALVATQLSVTPLGAHHAGATYDAEHPVTLAGTITEFQLVNPHTQIKFDVKDANGNVESWVGVSGPPQRMYRSGWRTDSLKAGDKVTITGAPSKDGRKYMGVKQVVGPSGKVMNAEGE